MNRLWLLLLTLLTISSVAAHQFKTAVTTVLFNDRTGNMEVMHRFYIHDAEHALQKWQGHFVDLHHDNKAQQQFADYVAGTFSLQRLDGSPIKLTAVGHQIEGKYLWVYQEAPIIAGLKGLRLRHSALQELWPAQVNMVNVEGKGRIRSRYFRNDSDYLEVRFDTNTP